MLVEERPVYVNVPFVIPEPSAGVGLVINMETAQLLFVYKRVFNILSYDVVFIINTFRNYLNYIG